MPLNVLAPWEALHWFDSPTERQVVLVASGVKQLVIPFEVRRVAFILSTDQANDVTLSVSPDQTISFGIRVPAGQLPLILTHGEHGPLVQCAWYAFGPLNAHITVVECLLRDWPEVPREEIHRA